MLEAMEIFGYQQCFVPEGTHFFLPYGVCRVEIEDAAVLFLVISQIADEIVDLGCASRLLLSPLI